MVRIGSGKSNFAGFGQFGCQFSYVDSLLTWSEIDENNIGVICFTIRSVQELFVCEIYLKLLNWFLFSPDIAEHIVT